MKKTRLDVLLVERGFFETREKAKRTVMAGLVFSEQTRLDKPGMKVNADIPIQIKGKTHNYVSRGGLKLEKALKYFELSVEDKIMIDIGSSTGGFTDCALQNGAKLSYAIDVGQNQLDWKLRSDDRVIVMEKTNFRYVTPDQLKQGRPNFASIDVSFISLRIILPVLKRLLLDESDIIALIKPQFEAGKEQVGKKGIVRDSAVHKEVLTNMIEFTVKEGYSVENLTYSPITGGEGNVEFLIHLKWSRQQNKDINDSINIDQIIGDANTELRK
ncbi:23S rRNA (cytidine1920-2'-O)/16S rRNA (cytidine1409-2'-O)-methyltransferase [Salinibacillus kushneri]|uniref:23S rRNA (Cytidine1920-2'-O)/16S rRNA (Cytidine1409-2'-O)-methyltransferase n=1 Tax=Salinibacillus kushneri TaxID=237682 RepID=A0A1I0FRT0_9BACI|nr:TlyA family RNA methyltransferase [Salinibacillus kushneri]SET60858.1 23S rRNA (cytidine1920-2'-O)/16S rRNA (cytidine1409-2'-O)-methyltransferase [Salinibacillus kushneri]